MTKPENSQCINVQEYLAMEEQSPIRHEYIDGRIFAMTGARPRHNIIARNLFSMLHAHLRGGRCRPYMLDVKVYVKTANSFYYPDVSVSCEGHEEDVFLTQPVLIAEVLSRSTSMIDRREKVLAYRQLEALKEHLIIYQTKQRVELHRTSKQGWEILDFGAGDIIPLQSMPAGLLQVRIEALYEGVDNATGRLPGVREAIEDQHLQEEIVDW